MGLTTLERAKDWLRLTDTNNDAIVERLIDAVTDRAQRFCNRTFASTTHSKRYDGSGTQWLELDEAPISAITRVSIGYNDAMSLTNNASDATAAVASISSTTLTLIVYGGASAGTSTLTLTDYTDITALAAAINALGTGWSASAMSTWADWAASDCGKCDFMGWECFGGDVIFLTVPGERENDFSYYADDGGLYRIGGWPAGHRNIFVDFTAGYSTIPDDLEQVALELVQLAYDSREHDVALKQERLGDYARTLVDATFTDAMRDRLSEWRWIPLGAS